ncbi:Crp/Fnr family transcriptional regulator [Picosynechococcus sp. PCC 8807]|uniref:Crp/Fnr family transcriptional regulator n=1 Tax=Picosynechococcus sp. PCC 8807 TaxID=195248 RepID=UPI0009FE1A61|nr:cyclic nucleotide-binding domain-containing protein [Picosynechococcus sp. PCC 8807]
MMAHFDLFRHDHDTQDFAAGTVIFSAGTPGDLLYIIQTGEVEIQFQGQPLSVLGEGEALGEMAVIEPGSPRSATAIAKTDCRLVVIDQKRFTFLIQQNPYFAIEIMKTLAERLSRTNQKLEAQG